MMADNLTYDTVAFDVRGNTAMLFFAKTTTDGDFVDYLLLILMYDDNFADSLYCEFQ